MALVALGLVAEAPVSGQPTGQSAGKKEIAWARDSSYRLTAESLEGQPADLGAYAERSPSSSTSPASAATRPSTRGSSGSTATCRTGGSSSSASRATTSGAQEPDTATEIREFCSLNYNAPCP